MLKDESDSQDLNETCEQGWARRGVTGEVMPDGGEYRVRLVQLRMCEACLLGLGSECHTPGCALWIHNSPGHALIPELVELVDPDAADHLARIKEMMAEAEEKLSPSALIPLENLKHALGIKP